MESYRGSGEKGFRRTDVVVEVDCAGGRKVGTPDFALEFKGKK